MSVFLSESGINALARSEPISDLLVETAKQLADLVDTKIAAIMASSPISPETAFHVSTDAEGLKAEVGMARSTRTAIRIGNKIGREDGGWLRFAEQAFR